MKARPKAEGYIGTRHETLGADILAVLQILKLPRQVLGPEEAARLALVEPDAWYPIEWLLDLMDKLDEQVGSYGLVRLGRTIFKKSHEAKVKEHFHSARDIVYALDKMYRRLNRGTAIGGWRVLRFEPGYAELEKTTPHHCGMEQGILLAALSAVGCPVAVSHKQCVREGAASCIFVMTSTITDERWGATSGV